MVVGMVLESGAGGKEINQVGFGEKINHNGKRC